MIAEPQELETTVWEDHFLDDLKSLAKFYIRRFFQDRMTPSGKEIPLDLVLEERYVMLVLNTDICNGIGKVYEAMERTRPEDPKADMEEIRSVLDTQRMCAKLGIPKCFSAGITMMYYQLCKDVDL